MMISRDIYNLFCKYGSGLPWVDDPIREPRPIWSNKKTDEAFIILEKLDENLELFYNEHYSSRLKNEFSEKIEGLKSKVTNEVFNLMKNKYKK